MIPRILRAAPAGVLLAGLVVSTVGPASPATAAPTEVVVTGQHLELTSVVRDEMRGLVVGQSASWDVGLRVLTSGEATVAVSLEVVQASANAFSVTVQRCDTRWTDDGCPSNVVPLVRTAVAAGGREHLDQVGGDESPWYRVAVSRTGGEDGAMSTLRIHADGAGEGVSTGPGGAAGGGAGDGSGVPVRATTDLPQTGVAPVSGLLLAIAAIGTGLAVALLGRLRTQRIR